MSVVDEAFKAVTKKSEFKTRVGRLCAAYVRRRAAALHAAHSGWSANKLAKQLKAEVNVVVQYAKDKHDALVGGTDAKSPQHLDLGAAAYWGPNAGFDPQGTALVAMIYVQNRTEWIPQIVWRAITVHHDVLWSSAAPPTLQTDALDELVDRRLRVVEQLTCNVNAVLGGELSTSARTWTVTGASGPWEDGYGVRNFEYIWLPKAPFASHLPIADWIEVGSSIEYEPPGGYKVRLPQDPHSWKPEGINTWWITYQPDPWAIASSVVQRLFLTPREDHYDRNLLFCDMVGSALNLEATWFGNRRRRGDNTDFDAVMDKEDYVSLGPVVQFDGRHDLDILMCDEPDDPFFENVKIDLDDLQVGDFTCVWNSRVYGQLVQTGAWGNEFSHVMSVDADPKTGKVKVGTDGPQIELAGHGMFTKTHGAMAEELAWITRRIVGTDTMVDLLVAFYTDQTITRLRLSSGADLVLWSPYEAFDPVGAWWLEVPRTVWYDHWDYPDRADVLAAVPYMISEAPGGTGYQPPPDTDAVYFPLFQPVVATTAADKDSWSAYLRQRKADATFRAPTTLEQIPLDARLAPGLFYRGRNAKFTVVRPRVRI